MENHIFNSYYRSSSMDTWNENKSIYIFIILIIKTFVLSWSIVIIEYLYMCQFLNLSILKCQEIFFSCSNLSKKNSFKLMVSLLSHLDFIYDIGISPSINTHTHICTQSKSSKRRMDRLCSTWVHMTVERTSLKCTEMKINVYRNAINNNRVRHTIARSSHSVLPTPSHYSSLFFIGRTLRPINGPSHSLVIWTNKDHDHGEKLTKCWKNNWNFIYIHEKKEWTYLEIYVTNTFFFI